MICEQCGGSRVVSYPPPACGCPGCGAPVCCQTCCDARSTGYAPEGNRAESTSSAAIPKMQAFAPMEEMARLRAELLAPGVMRCAKCNFGLQRVILNVNNGTSTSGDSKTEECPNGCGPLWPVTWKELSAEHLETAERFFDESAAAKKENDKLRAELAELRARAGELERQVRDKHEAATVDEICNAYESGVGHRGRPTASVNPYRQGSDLATAYNIGALGDRESPAAAAVPDDVAKDAERYRACRRAALAADNDPLIEQMLDWPNVSTADEFDIQADQIAAILAAKEKGQ